MRKFSKTVFFACISPPLSFLPSFKHIFFTLKLRKKDHFWHLFPYSQLNISFDREKAVLESYPIKNKIN